MRTDEYDGKALTLETTTEILNHGIPRGGRYTAMNIAIALGRYYVVDKNGELPERGSMLKMTHLALNALTKEGRARRCTRHRPIDKHIYEIYPRELRVFGYGNEAVYCYYDPIEKVDAQSVGKTLYPCNIGQTRREVPLRVKEKTQHWKKTDYRPDFPCIALILRTHNARRLESQIHKSLKDAGRHIDAHDGRTDWFETSDDEVLNLYRDAGRGTLKVSDRKQTV